MLPTLRENGGLAPFALISASVLGYLSYKFYKISNESEDLCKCIDHEKKRADEAESAKELAESRAR